MDGKTLCRYSCGGLIAYATSCLRQENKWEFPDCAIIPEVGESPRLQASSCVLEPDQREGGSTSDHH